MALQTRPATACPMKRRESQWVAMKLVANRDQDRYHVVEALKEASQPRIAVVAGRLQGMPPRVLGGIHASGSHGGTRESEELVALAKQAAVDGLRACKTARSVSADASRIAA